MAKASNPQNLQSVVLDETKTNEKHISINISHTETSMTAGE